MGRTGVQLTGKANDQAFYDWSEAKGFNPADFVANPDLADNDPWEGLVPLWYWGSHNLNRFADQGDIETITTKTNGGMNGFDDRVDHFAHPTLVLVLKPTAIRTSKWVKFRQKCATSVTPPRVRSEVGRKPGNDASARGSTR